ncbi:MAG: hypothetical protein ACKO96_13200, partial [Flammeovirgaceae bacterium]
SKRLKASHKDTANIISFYVNDLLTSADERFRICDEGELKFAQSKLLEPQVGNLILKLAQFNERSVRIVVMAGFAVLLRKLTGRKRIHFAEIRSSEGESLRILPIAFSVEGQITFKELLLSTREWYEKADGKGAVLLDQLVEAMQMAQPGEIFQAFFDPLHEASMERQILRIPIPLQVGSEISGGHVRLHVSYNRSLRVGANELLSYLENV